MVSIPRKATNKVKYTSSLSVNHWYFVNKASSIISRASLLKVLFQHFFPQKTSLLPHQQQESFTQDGDAFSTRSTLSAFLISRHRRRHLLHQEATSCHLTSASPHLASHREEETKVHTVCHEDSRSSSSHTVLQNRRSDYKIGGATTRQEERLHTRRSKTFKMKTWPHSWHKLYAKRIDIAFSRRSEEAISQVAWFRCDLCAWCAKNQFRSSRKFLEEFQNFHETARQSAQTQPNPEKLLTEENHYHINYIIHR